MGLALIQIHIQDPDGKPLSGVLLNATSPTVGPWSGMTDCAGNFIPSLSPAHYDIRLSKPGYKEIVWPTDLADCGVITQQMEYDSVDPTRDQIINVQGNFLNLFDNDDIPIWDIYLATLLVQGNTDKFNDWISRLRAANTTHINLAISYNYNEPLGWINRYPLDPMDFTQRLNDFANVVVKIRSLGFIPIIKLAFDGQGFDPNGWTYGWQWGLDNIDRIANELSAFNTNSLWSTGYDGCFPNWTPDQTRQVLRKMRAVLQTACIDTEFGGPGTVGYCHMGQGPSDWVPDSLGILDSFSIEGNTFPPNSTGYQQTASRLLGPAAKNIDPSNVGPYYLQQMSTIKKINIGAYETCAFDAIRKNVTSVSAVQAAQFLATFGLTSFGNGQP